MLRSQATVNILSSAVKQMKTLEYESSSEIPPPPNVSSKRLPRWWQMASNPNFPHTQR